MAQLDYNPPARSIPGMLADIGPSFTLTYKNQDRPIPYGRALVSATDEGTCMLPNAPDLKVQAVSRRDLSGSSEGYLTKSLISGLRQGRIHVQVEEEVKAGDPVYVRFAGKKQVQTLSFDGEFVLGNTIHLKINGLAMKEVVFEKDQATTMALLQGAIAAMEGVEQAQSNGQAVTIISKQDVELQISDVLVTGGDSQAVGSVELNVLGRSLADRGSFRKSDDDGTAYHWKEAEYLSSAAAGETTILGLNLP